MAKRKPKDEDEEEMVMVGPGADGDEDEEEEHEVETPEPADEEEEEQPPKKKGKDEESEEDDDEPEEDERVGHGEDDGEDDEEAPHAKRESRKARRERQKRARQRNELELNFLRQRNEALEKKVGEIESRQNRSEVGNLDQRIAGMQSQLKVADQVLAKAIEAGDGDDVVEAQNIRDKIRDNLGRLNSFKQEVARRAEERSDEPAVDSRLVFHAQNWINQNRWYNPQGGDQDSRAVTAIDNRLVQEGYDPRTPEYWEELDARVRGRLPHRFKSEQRGRDDDEEEPSPRREQRRGNGGPRFSVNGRERPLRKNEVYVNPERKQAMQEAGVWDDPVLRNKYLKRYAQWDRENPRGRSAR